MTGPQAGTAEQVGAIAAVATAVLVTGAGFGMLAAGGSEGWLVLAVGWGVLVPLAAGTGGLVARTIETGFDAALAVVRSRDGRSDIAVTDLTDDGDPDRSRVRDSELSRFGRY